MSTGQSPTALVTGAAGLVGAQVCAELLAAGYRVIALVHRSTQIATADGPVRSARLLPVTGDVRVTSCGLDAELLEVLEGRVEVVIHCAATTAFGETEAVYEELNVGGTRNAIALARRLGARLVQVSTAYVCGRLEDVAGPRAVFTEADLDCGQRFHNGYEASKLRAEQLVWEAHEHGLPVAVVRPGIVCGDTRRGALRDHKNLYLVLKMITEGKLRTLPGRYGATVALAPVDLVARVVRYAVTDQRDGETFHAVGADELSLRDISDVLAEYPCFAINRYVPPAGFDIEQLDRRERGYYERVAREYSDYFVRTVRFDTTNTRALLAQHGEKLPASGPNLLRLLLDSCIEVGYLADRRVDVDSIVARVKQTAAARKADA